jgi:predicted kinase
MITVLMGAPAAGKSTWLKANAIGDEHIYNTEAIRVYRDIDRDLYMRNIRRQAYLAVKDGKSVIADGTHTMAQHRNYWLKVAKEFEVKTKLVLFDTPLNVLLIGNAKRLHPAPVKVVRDHYVRFNRSKELVRLEPWDQIEIIMRDK